jgi:HAD superfamily hydrolase (TIGR01509 family)
MKFDERLALCEALQLGIPLEELSLAAHRGLVIFDFDGVLVDSELLAARGYKSAFEEIGLEIPAGIMDDAIGLKQDDIFARIEAEAGRPIPAGVSERLWARTREIFEAELESTAGLSDFLDHLTHARCIASSSDVERIRFSLRVTGLERYFGDAVFSTHLVTHGKPAPDIFLYAARRMGVEPGRCVVIEDSEPGVRGAVAAGMRAIGFLGGAHIRDGHGETLREAGAGFLATNWTEVARLLASEDLLASS